MHGFGVPRHATHEKTRDYTDLSLRTLVTHVSFSHPQTLPLTADHHGEPVLYVDGFCLVLRSQGKTKQTTSVTRRENGQ